MTASSTDRIEKQVMLKASPARVWRALTNSEEFGAWFRVKLEGPFEVGRWVGGNITYSGYELLRMEVLTVTMEPEKCFAFRWHPYAVEVGKDYSHEPTTLVQFELQPVSDGTRLLISESGFDQLPPERRQIAFRANEGGWSSQAKNITAYLGE